MGARTWRKVTGTKGNGSKNWEKEERNMEKWEQELGEIG